MQETKILPSSSAIEIQSYRPMKSLGPHRGFGAGQSRIMADASYAWVELAENTWCIIDLIDITKILGVTWSLDKSTDKTWYAKNKRQRMHRLILPGILIDHIDMNGLNNTRSNLRVATKSQNNRNKDKTKRNQSGFKGVHLNSNNKWQATIKNNGKSVYLGQFSTPEEAFETYNVACINLREGGF